MIHAFIFGTNIFISAQTTIDYAQNGQRYRFLNIVSFYKDQLGGGNHFLTIDADFEMPNGEPVKIQANKLVSGRKVNVRIDAKRVRIYHDGHDMPVLDVFQLDEAAYQGFGSHIANELTIREPDFAVTIKANIIVAGAPIWISDDALHINEESFAMGVNNAHHGVVFASDGHDYE